jgi:hypothetical protein
VGAVTLKAGPDLCALLSAADLTAAGVAGAGPVLKNALLAPTNFSCVYAGLSSGTGGIELDIQIIDPKGGDQVTGTVPAFGSEEVTQQVPGSDKALLYVPSFPATDPASIGVQAGTIEFGLGIPANDGAKAALIGLGSLIVARAAAASTGALTLPIQPLLPPDVCDWVTTSDLGSISNTPLTAAEPQIGGEFGFNDASVGGTYLGKQVTCIYKDGKNNNGLRVDVLHEPSDQALIDKVYAEQVAFYQNAVANPGELSYAVSPLSGVGTGAQKIKVTYTSGGAFVNWILEATQGPIIVRLETDAAAGAEAGADPALVTLLGKVLGKAVAAVSG